MTTRRRRRTARAIAREVRGARVERHDARRDSNGDRARLKVRRIDRDGRRDAFARGRDGDRGRRRDDANAVEEARDG
jgi:hypothetical protein